MNEPKPVTGRDGLIMAFALAHAAAAISHLPQAYQNLSDRADMLAILRAKWPAMADALLAEASERMSHLEDRYRSHPTQRTG